MSLIGARTTAALDHLMDERLSAKTCINQDEGTGDRAVVYS